MLTAELTGRNPGFGLAENTDDLFVGKTLTVAMLYLTTLSNDSIMLKKDDIIFMKSCGNAKTIIFLRGVDEKLMINASFEEIKFAINNNLQELPGVQAVAATLKIAT
ncbi:MAG: hypothetical protein E6308_24775 [Escherichia coli]|nr:hypothetical protein [Escherichia coli]